MPLLGLAPMDTDGVDLSPAMAGERLPERTLYAESFAPLLDFGWSPLRAVRRDGWKYIGAPTPELYHTTEDINEARNLIDREPARVSDLRPLVDRFSGTEIASAPTTEPETRARLQALGYVSGGAPAAGPRPDPKDRREIAARIAQVTSGELHGDALERLLRRILADDPENPLANLRLGYVLLESGRCDDAAPRFAAAIAAKYPSADPHMGLAACQAAQGQHRVAAATLRQADADGAGQPGGAREPRGDALRRRGAAGGGRSAAARADDRSRAAPGPVRARDRVRPVGPPRRGCGAGRGAAPAPAGVRPAASGGRAAPRRGEVVSGAGSNQGKGDEADDPLGARRHVSGCGERSPQGAQEPTQQTLTLRSRVFTNTRSIRVLLPPGYSAPESRTTRYPVFYFTDGVAAWDAWAVPATVKLLFEERAIPPFIFVGIDNGGSTRESTAPVRDRASEYLPYSDQTWLEEPPEPVGNQFPKFLLEEVIPLIDATFRTMPAGHCTGLAGASYGAAVTLYTAMRHPGRFGFILLESPSLHIGEGALLKDAAATVRWPARVHIGVGTAEGDTSDARAGMVADARALRAAIDRAGTTSVVRLLEQEGATHWYDAWKERLPGALTFLLSGDAAVRCVARDAGDLSTRSTDS